MCTVKRTYSERPSKPKKRARRPSDATATSPAFAHSVSWPETAQESRRISRISNQTTSECIHGHSEHTNCYHMWVVVGSVFAIHENEYTMFCFMYNHHLLCMYMYVSSPNAATRLSSIADPHNIDPNFYHMDTSSQPLHESSNTSSPTGETEQDKRARLTMSTASRGVSSLYLTHL